MRKSSSWVLWTRRLGTNGGACLGFGGRRWGVEKGADMNETYASDARRDAQRDLLAHPERPWPHADLAGRLVAGFAYENLHPHDVTPPMTYGASVEETPAIVALAGKYLSASRLSGAMGLGSPHRCGLSRKADGCWW